MEELHFTSFFVLFTFLLFLVMLLKIVERSSGKNPTPKLPPGPWKLPLIGNMLQLVGSLPHHSLNELTKKHGPLMHLQLGKLSMIVVSSPDIAKEVMKTHDLIFAQRPVLLATEIVSYNSSGLSFSPYGPYWRQLRKICTMKVLSAKRVESFRSIREEEVSNLIKTIYSNNRSPINLSKNIYSLTAAITARAAFGKKNKDQEEFINAVVESLKLSAGFCIADMYPSAGFLHRISGLRLKLERIFQKTDRIIENIVKEHRERKKTTKSCNGEEDEDLVDVLLKIQEHGDLEYPLTDNHIKAVILDIFGAGSETSSTTVEWAMSEMLKNPRVMTEAQAEVRRVFDGKGGVDETGIDELKFIQLVIKETLRLHPPGPLLLRESRESCEINGYEIPVKTRVIINAWAIGRDPRYWDEADNFYPERFLDSSIDYRGTDFEYIPFGAGRRICPGISFALANIVLPLANLLYHFDWKLPNGMKQEDLDMTEAYSLTANRKNNLFSVPIPYHPLSIE